MPATKFKNIQDRYQSLRNNRDEYLPLWQDISKYVGIKVDPRYLYTKDQRWKSDVLDEQVDDPTSALSVVQAGDYLMGIMWGTGDNAITIMPSEHVLQKADLSTVDDFYRFVSSRVLEHMNHAKGGLNTALKQHFYDQFAFGTSGVGAFPNSGFIKKQEENALVFRMFGVDSIAIDEGKNGLVDVIYVAYQWRVNRIVSEFAEASNGEVDERKLKKLPKRVIEDFQSNNFNTEYTVVQAVFPREDFNPKLKGRKGTKYEGHWFLDDQNNKIFFKESYAVLPIAIARAIKVRGEVYGRASGSMILSTIRSVNFMVGKTIEVLEKIASPSLGIWNAALFGDSVLDTSADGLNVFNQGMMGNSGEPVFKIHDVGDPVGIINFLIPYFNEKITTAFKVDILLDFNAKGDRTATELIQRSIIRGKALAGMTQQQALEMFIPLIERSISLLWQMNIFGVDESLDPKEAKRRKLVGREDTIIPPAVLETVKEGKPWFKIRFNGELDRLTRTEALEKIVKALQILTALAAVFPGILEAVKWYDMWKDINDFLGIAYIKDEEEFKASIKEQADQQRLLIAAQMQKTGAGIEKDLSSAKKNNTEAQQK